MGCVFLRVGGVFLRHLQLETGCGAQPLILPGTSSTRLIPRAEVGGKLVSAMAPCDPQPFAGCVGAPQPLLLLSFPLPEPGRKWAGKGYRSDQGGLQGK